MGTVVKISNRGVGKHRRRQKGLIKFAKKKLPRKIYRNFGKRIWNVIRKLLYIQNIQERI